MSDEIRFVVYNKAEAFQRVLVPAESTSELVANDTCTSEFVVDDDDPALPALTAAGARCGFWFRGVEWFRGRVAATPGAGPFGRVTVRVESDHRKMWDWQGWPLTTAPVTGQTAEYARYSGVTETVVKAALAANFTRLGVPWSVVATAGRGITGQRVEFRFHPLAEKLFPLLDAANLILDLAYAPTGAVSVDVHAAATVAGVITEQTGVLDGYAWTRDAPSATRVVVGGSGEGTARKFLQRIDAAREASWGDIIETFTDSRGAEATDDLTPDAVEALAEGAPVAGVSLELVESERLRFGTHFRHGDRVRVKVGPVDVTERIGKVTISDTVSDGVVVTPLVGAIEDSPDAKLGAQVARLARGVRDAGRR